MRQTLFVIPQTWFEGPLLWAWLFFSVFWLGWLWLQKPRSEAKSGAMFLLIGALVIWLVLPQLSVYGVDPNNPNGELIKIGLAVRGYGVFLLMAIVTGVGITVYRGNRIGIASDKIISLAFWMIVFGLLGARLFYLIQKREEFFSEGSLFQQLARALDPTQGGLVVFGSLFGGSLAALVYLKMNRMPVLRTLDLIAPGMALGLAIGRVGCLMNGCCYGGVAEIDRLPTLQFPAGSAPYMQQLIEGDLVGIRTIANLEDLGEKDAYRYIVTVVETGSIGDQLGIVPNDRLTIFPPDELKIRFFLTGDRSAADSEEVVYLASDRQGLLELPLSRLPRQSLATHPTQVYSSVDAFLLSIFLWFYWNLRKIEGEVFGLMLLLHGASRFLLEMIRQDELGIWGTPLTISQWISLFLIVGGIVWIGTLRSKLPISDRLGDRLGTVKK